MAGASGGPGRPPGGLWLGGGLRKWGKGNGECGEAGGMNPPYPRFVRGDARPDPPAWGPASQRLDQRTPLNRHFPAPLHWKGPLTPGEVLAVWLLFLVSQGDHCLNHVQPWVAQHQRTLSALLGKDVLPTHVHDDRLADWLTRLGAGASFGALERDLNQ